MTPLPKTKEELEAMGYSFRGRSKCRGKNCGQTISWWRTPNHKDLPLDEGTYEPHWATCADVEKFRGEK